MFRRHRQSNSPQTRALAVTVINSTSSCYHATCVLVFNELRVIPASSALNPTVSRMPRTQDSQPSDFRPNSRTILSYTCMIVSTDGKCVKQDQRHERFIQCIRPGRNRWPIHRAPRAYDCWSYFHISACVVDQCIQGFLYERIGFCIRQERRFDKQQQWRPFAVCRQRQDLAYACVQRCPWCCPVLISNSGGSRAKRRNSCHMHYVCTFPCIENAILDLPRDFSESRSPKA